MRSHLRYLVPVLAILLLAAAPMFAATQNAVVYGTVYDASGNPLPGITVNLDNAGQGFARETATGSDGSYTFSEVPPADGYRLTAARSGKKIDIRSGITVNVGDERVILPPLKEQAAATTNAPVVERKVEAAAVANETVSTAISGVINGDQLRSLPVALNRNFLNAGLIPPQTHDVAAGSELSGASFSVSGMRDNSNNFLLDGSDNVASSSNQAVPFQVNDAIQEFRVTSSTAPAEYGRNTGGVVNVVTRRGSNGFHGSVFGYFNDDRLNGDSPISVYRGTTFDQAAIYAGPTNAPALTIGRFLPSPLNYNSYVATAQANGYCTNSISVTAAPGLVPCTFTGGFGLNQRFDPAAVLRTNDSRTIPFTSSQFGANAGGALIKDKLFYFASYEATIIRNPNPIFERVPSTFDRTYAPFGAAFATPFAGAGANDPNYLLDTGILNLFPAPNVIGVPNALEFFRGQAPNYTHVHNGLGRGDWLLTSKSSISVRYAVQGLSQLHDDTLPKQSQYPGNGALRDALNQNLSGTLSHSFTPNLINDIRVGFSRFRVDEEAQDRRFNAGSLGTAGSNIPSRAMPTVLLNGLDQQYSGSVPGFSGAYRQWFDPSSPAPMLPTLDYLFPMPRIGAPLSAPSGRKDTTIFAADNVSWTHGKHTIKAGIEYRHLNDLFTNNAFNRGFWYSSDVGEFSHDSNSTHGPIDRRDYFAPSFDFALTQTQGYRADLDSWAFAGYVQDTVHLTSRVTLNLGMRYEFFSTPHESNDRLWNFDPTGNGLVREGGAAIVDPYGVPCDGSFQQGNYLSAPPASGGAFIVQFFGGAPGPWNCTPSVKGAGEFLRKDGNNFAPRIGLAWDVRGDAKTVVRMGFGLYYDQLPASYMAQLMFNRPTSPTANPNALFGVFNDFVNFCNFAVCGVGSSIVNPAVLARPATTNVGTVPLSSVVLASQPFAIYSRDTANSATPYTYQFNLGVQQQISKNLTTEIAYVGSAGARLPVVYDRNFGNEFNILNQTGGNITFFPVMTMTNRADSNYHSLLARARVADWHGLRFNATYIWSKSLDNSSNGVFPVLPTTANNLALADQFFTTFNPVVNCVYFGNACNATPLVFPNFNFSSGAVTTTGQGQVLTSRYLLPQDPFHFLRDDYGRSDFNVAHRFVLDYIYEVPSLQKAYNWPKWLDYWQLSGVFTAQTGQPYTIFAGPILGQVNQRVNVIGRVSRNNDNPNAAISTTGLQLATTACFDPINGIGLNPIQPAPGTACTGNSGRNAFIGPKYINFNFAIQKGFPVFGEGRMLTFRTEVYNLFGNDNFYNPISQASVDGFNMNPDFGRIKSAHEPRQIQFALRFSW